MVSTESGYIPAGPAVGPGPPAQENMLDQVTCEPNRKMRDLGPEI